MCAVARSTGATVAPVGAAGKRHATNGRGHGDDWRRGITRLAREARERAGVDQAARAVCAQRQHRNGGRGQPVCGGCRFHAPAIVAWQRLRAPLAAPAAG